MYLSFFLATHESHEMEEMLVATYMTCLGISSLTHVFFGGVNDGEL
jgi:hypothetical protein